MNILTLEFYKFLRGKLIPTILVVIFILFGSIFYKNHLDYKQIDSDKKSELVKIKAEIDDILYPKTDKNAKSIYANDENKMRILKESLEIADKTMYSKFGNDENIFMNNAILMYGKIIEMNDNEISFSISNSTAKYEKERLSEIVKAKSKFQYENAPLDSMLLEYKNIKYILSTILLISILYFFITTYFDFKNHSGFLFTLPINKNKFIVGKAIISMFVNLFLILAQLFVMFGFGKAIKWKNDLKYPVYENITKTFIPVKKAISIYIGIEVILCFVFLVISVVICKIYFSKNK